MIRRYQRIKYLKIKLVSIGAFLGGPLAAGYFFAKNFKAINEPEKVKTTWVITILSTIAIFSLAFIIPDNSNFPNQLIPAIYTGLAYFLFKSHQEEKVLQKIESGATYHSWGRVIGISVLGLLITFVAIGIGIFTLIGIEESNITSKEYGLTVKHEIEYDSSNLTEAEVDTIADGFIEHAFFDLDTAKYVYVEKAGNTYILYIPILQAYINDQQTSRELKILRDKMDTYFPDKSITIKLAVDSLDNVVETIN